MESAEEIVEEFPVIGKYQNEETELDEHETFLSLSKKYKTENHGKVMMGGKVILVGPTNAGKTCLFRRYIANKFDDNYKATIGFDITSVKATIFGVNSNIQLWDTAGSEQYQSLTKNYFRDAACAILCFDCFSSDSFYGSEFWLKTLKEECEEDIKIFLVACKSDKGLIVKEEEIQEFSEKNNLEFFETSSKTKKNINTFMKRVMYYVAKTIISKEISNDEENEKKAEKEEKEETNAFTIGKGSKNPNSTNTSKNKLCCGK